MSANFPSDNGYIFRVADFFMKAVCTTHLSDIAPVLLTSKDELLDRGAGLLRANPPLISCWRSTTPNFYKPTSQQNNITNYFRYGDPKNEVKYKYTTWNIQYNITCVSYLQAEQNSFTAVCSTLDLFSNMPLSFNMSNIPETYFSIFPDKALIRLVGISSGYTNENIQARLLETVATFEVLISLPLIISDSGDFLDTFIMNLEVIGEPIIVIPIIPKNN